MVGLPVPEEVLGQLLAGPQPGEFDVQILARAAG
jgi:hypothetical protein